MGPPSMGDAAGRRKGTVLVADLDFGPRRGIRMSVKRERGIVMDVEKDIAAHYTRGTLEEKIVGGLRSAGKSMDQLTVEDFAALDNFHVGGHEATESLASFMDLQPGMQVLDVGRGVGGPARYFAAHGCQVTATDLTDEFVRVAESLTRI